MFDIGFWELAVIGAIMLVVLGPERLPGVARTAGFWMSKLRRMVSDVKREVKREMDAAEMKELEDAKNQIQQASSAVQKQMNADVLSDAKPAASHTSNKSSTQLNPPAPDQVAQTGQAEEEKDDTGRP